MSQKYEQPIALVTGASRRIGAVIAQHLHQAGYGVIVHGHQSYHVGQQLVQMLNQKKSNSAKQLLADLSDPTAITSLVDESFAWQGRLDVLVNNASIFSMHDEDWQALFDINVKAPYLLSRAAFPYLSKAYGSIVNITDIHAEQPLKGYAAYCQSKAALWMQTRALAREFAPHVRVNAVAPGAIVWPEGDNVLAKERRDSIIEATPLKRHGSPVFVAQAVLSLLGNSFVTGQSLRVDGGRVM